jgi:proteasome lid subunit RPN8/RPN11
MAALLRRAGPREIGGILMAEQLSEPGHFSVVDFSVDPNSGRDDFFERDPSSHTATLLKFFARHGHDYGRFNYLGEWHSHPCFPLRPSLRDIRTMLDLVHGEAGIDFALLMIVKLRSPFSIEGQANLFARGRKLLPVTLSGMANSAPTLDQEREEFQ